ncbi:hypothetical protein BRC2024_HCTLARHO_CDS_0025 [Acinetobacter phage vB_AbaS_Silvergun]
MSDIEKRARELLAVVHSEAGWHRLANEIRMNSTFDIDHSLALAAIRVALTPPDGYVLVPVKMTNEMYLAAMTQGPNTILLSQWEAMLAARPEVK